MEMYWIIGAAGIALAGGLLYMGKKQTPDNVKHVDVSEFSKELKEKNVLLLDVRTPDEFKSGHIKGARNVNFFDGDFSAQLQGLDTSATLLVYCRSGNRSARAATKASKLGFDRVVDLKGGISAWRSAGMELAR